MGGLPQRVEKVLAKGEDCYERAHKLRVRVRKTTIPGASSREIEINAAIEDIDYAMKPIRSLIGKSLWELVPQEEELRDLSKRLQLERRQLKKMRRPEE